MSALIEANVTTDGQSFTIAAGPRQRSHSRVKSRGTRDNILLCQIRDFPFCSFLRLAGLRWRYSSQSQSQSYVTTDGSVGQSVLE
jgi:hypothetical protein